MKKGSYQCIGLVLALPIIITHHLASHSTDKQTERDTERERERERERVRERERATVVTSLLGFVKSQQVVVLGAGHAHLEYGHNPGPQPAAGDTKRSAAINPET